MIPRLKPYFGFEEISAVLNSKNVRVNDFEIAFSKKFKSKYAIAFPYGRSGLWSLFKSLGLNNAEVIMPAYTCVVVAHAIVLSGNIPRFVDIALPDFNMDLDLMDKAITKKTRTVIATHLFGYPMNMYKLKSIVEKHENKYGHKIYIINDCAHSFGAKYMGQLVTDIGDAAIYALNISKLMSSIFGGMITTNNPEIYEALRKNRDEVFVQPTSFKQFKRAIYLLSTYATFNKTIYGFVNYIEENTKLIDKFTKYYDEGKIYFPDDWKEIIGKVEAAVGLEQLKKYDEIINTRIKNAKNYDEKLRTQTNMKLPPIIDGATYSHYVPIVEDRGRIMNYMKSKAIQVGQLIEYSIPHMKAYNKYANDERYPISSYCSDHTINLPVYTEAQLDKVVETITS